MVFPATEVAVAVLLILSLLVLLRLRRYIGSGEGHGYTQMVLGLTVLATAAIARGHFLMGNLDVIPFVGDPLVFRLLEWMAVIAGSILLVSGISEYLPAARHARRYSEERFRRLELIKKMDQLVAVESREPDLFLKALDHIMAQYRMPAGAVFRYGTDGSLACLRAAGEYEAHADMVKGVSFDTEALGHSAITPGGGLAAVRDWPSSSRPPDLVLPIVVEGRLEAVYAFQSVDMTLADEDLLNLKSSVDVLSRNILSRRYESRRLLKATERHWREQTARNMDYTVGLRPNLTRLAESFGAEISGATLIYLSRRKDRRIDRCTVGANGAFLHEPGLTADRISPAFVEVCCGKGGRLVRLEDDSTSDLAGLGLRRAAVAPLRPGSECQGALIVAWSDHVEVPPNILDRVSRTAPLLEPLAAIQSVRRENRQFEKRTATLIGLLQRATRQGDLADCIQQAAEVLTSELGTSMVRVSTYEADGRHLRSRGFSVSGACAVATPTDSVMDLESMPYHRLVRDTKRLMLINQEDTKRRIEREEARLIGSEQLRSALLVPVVVNDLVLAVVSIGDLKKWYEDRWDHSSIQFANTVAHVIALSIRMSLRRRDRGETGRISLTGSRIDQTSTPQPA